MSIVITVEPARKPGQFVARTGDHIVVPSTRQPFLDAARVLVAEGHDPSITIVVRHVGSTVDALKAMLGTPPD